MFAWRGGQGHCTVWQQQLNMLQWVRVPGVRLQASQGEDDWEPADRQVCYD